MVTWDGCHWGFPGGTVEPGESVEATLVREVAEEACAHVLRHRYLPCQHVADPLNPDGVPSYYQTRWWARIALDPWQPRHERSPAAWSHPTRSYPPCPGDARTTRADCWT